jgi:hypothetical protein
LYVDDAFVVHHDAMMVSKEIDKYFCMKPGSIGDPSYYLGARLSLIKLPNGVQAWAMSPSKYLQNAVRNIKEYLKKIGDSRIDSIMTVGVAASSLLVV